MSDDNYLLPFPRRFWLLIDETRASQQEIAGFVGVSRQAVSQWKDGKTTPDIYNFRKIAEFFKVLYEYLLEETDSRIRENMKIAEELKLSDRAIERLIKWAAVEKENKTDAPRYEILSALLSANDFELFLDSVRKFISEYLGHRFYEDEQKENELLLKFRYQAIEILGRILELMPEDYYAAYHLISSYEADTN